MTPVATATGGKSTYHDCDPRGYRQHNAQPTRFPGLRGRPCVPLRDLLQALQDQRGQNVDAMRRITRAHSQRRPRSYR
jgi:hypothetical protein